MRELIAASWEIASRLAYTFPELRVYEYHPAGGSYDTLAVYSDKVHIDINRGGSIHLHVTPGGTRTPLYPPEAWDPRVLGLARAQEIASRLETVWLTTLPKGSHSRASIGYRAVARLLMGRLADKSEWDARLQCPDDGWDSAQVRWPSPAQVAAAAPTRETWVVTRDDEPVAFVWDGHAWLVDGSHVDLASRFGAGSGVDSLVADLTRKPGKKAKTLPLNDPRYRSGELPQWPSANLAPGRHEVPFSVREEWLARNRYDRDMWTDAMIAEAIGLGL